MTFRTVSPNSGQNSTIYTNLIRKNIMYTINFNIWRCNSCYCVYSNGVKRGVNRKHNTVNSLIPRGMVQIAPLKRSINDACGFEQQCSLVVQFDFSVVFDLNRFYPIKFDTPLITQYTCAVTRHCYCPNFDDRTPHIFMCSIMFVGSLLQ